MIGRDLEIAATMRLLSSTPKSLQPKVFLALDLRAGGGARYQLAVYPLQRKAQLRKFLADGSVEYLQIEKNVQTVKGVDKANKLRLRAFNITSGPDKGNCRILAFVGGEQVGDFTDTGGRGTAGTRLGLRGRRGEERQGRRRPASTTWSSAVPNPF